MWVVSGERPHTARRIARIGTLDLRHLRPEVRQQLGAVWTCDVMSQVQDFQTFQRGGQHFLQVMGFNRRVALYSPSRPSAEHALIPQPVRAGFMPAQNPVHPIIPKILLQTPPYTLSLNSDPCNPRYPNHLTGGGKYDITLTSRHGGGSAPLRTDKIPSPSEPAPYLIRG